MSPVRSGLAAFAALALLPASGHAAGGSCEQPVLWKLSPAQVKRVAAIRGVGDSFELRHGPVTFEAIGGNGEPGALVRAKGSGAWRICTLQGRTDDGRSWSMAGTRGARKQSSFALRKVASGEGTGFSYGKPTRLSVAYARRTSTVDCDNPRVVYFNWTGDPGAAITKKTWGMMEENWDANWSVTRPGATVCRAEGFSANGEPWVVGPGGTTGGHAMHRDRRVGTHADPIVYLWVAFA